MRLQQTFTLLRLLFDSRLTQTPRQVFRQLKIDGRLRGGVRAKLSRGPLERIALMRHVLRWLKGEYISRHGEQWVLNTFLPPFPGPAFDRLFTSQLSNRRYTPVSAYLAITSRCPASCWHCSIKNRQEAELPLEIWQKTIAGLHEIGASIFGITGGEPLVRSDLAEIVKTVKDGGGEAMIFTSGIGLTPEKAKELKLAGLWAVCVSLDRGDPEQFDKLRGVPDSLGIARRALTTAKDAGLYTCVNCVADREVVSTGLYRKLYEISRELRVDEFRLIEPMPCGRLADAPKDIGGELPQTDSPFLTPELVREVRRYHRDTNQRLKPDSRGVLPPKVCAFNEIESPELFGCAAGTRHLFIDPAGEVCPCDFTPLSFGNIAEESIAEIWDRMSAAMKHPRRRCLIQHQTKLIHDAIKDRTPAPLEVSLATAAAFPEEDLPDFVRWMEG